MLTANQRDFGSATLQTDLSAAVYNFAMKFKILYALMQAII
jgi:hypothetical protein